MKESQAVPQVDQGDAVRTAPVPMVKKRGSGSFVVIICAVAAVVGFVAGRQSIQPTGKFAFAEKGAIITEAIFARQDLDEAALKKEVVQPILGVLQRWSDQGYIVIDSSKDEQGNFAVLAIPDGAKDISAEMREAIKLTATESKPQEGKK